MKVLNGTESFILKWLVSCYVNFTSTKTTTPGRWDSGDSRTSHRRSASPWPSRRPSTARESVSRHRRVQRPRTLVQNVGFAPVAGTQQLVNPGWFLRQEAARTQPLAAACSSRSDTFKRSSTGQSERLAPTGPADGRAQPGRQGHQGRQGRQGRPCHGWGRWHNTGEALNVRYGR